MKLIFLFSRYSFIAFSPLNIRQMGQLVPYILWNIEASHSCSLLHFHQIFFPEPRETSEGFILFLGCHSAAKSGLNFSRELQGQTFCPAQNGQLVPSVLLATDTSHSWCSQFALVHFHQTFLLDFTLTSEGFILFLGCHSAAKSGLNFLRELQGQTRCPEQKGQFSPNNLLATETSHTWWSHFALLHFHQIFLLE